MRLPLLVCGTPKNLEVMPIVHLPAGRYKVIMENHIDSIISPEHFSMTPAGRFQIKFDFIGTETNLNIYAEKLE